jgi:hypothetical protein
MGYTCGRRHTEESLREIAKQFKTRTEFQKADASAYSRARLKGKVFLDSICEHMVKGNYSTPQLICKHIMEKLLGIKCIYSTKSIIKPYELDIYFPEFKLAIEYNGKGWHYKENVIERDKNKKQLCHQTGITLIVIVENNRDYERDVKMQLIQHLDVINNVTKRNFKESDIVEIDCLNVFEDIFKKRDINEIKKKISECSSIKEFRKKYVSEYNFLRKNKKLELLNEIRIFEQYSDEELMEKCKQISNYSDLLKNHYTIYQLLYKRGLLEKATEHMDKKRRPYRNHTNNEILELANKFKMKSHLKKRNTSLYLELMNRKILDSVVYDPNFIYKPHNKILKEIALTKCFDDAKKYNNYEDFKNDKDLYDRCTKYKIVRKIVETFPKKNINDVILEESKKYKNFKEFTNSILYLKTKKIPKLIQKVKSQNNWSFNTKEKTNYIKMFPQIVEMINNDTAIQEISNITGINKTTIWRVKTQMKDEGILKVKFNIRKKLNTTE